MKAAQVRLRVVAAAICLGVLVAIGAAGEFVKLIRDQIHVGCGYYTMGEVKGSFSCTDGAGYVFGLGLLYFVLLVEATILWLVILRAARWGEAGPGRLRIVMISSILPLATLVLVTLAVSSNRPQDDAIDKDYWSPAVLPVAILFAVASVGIVMASFASHNLRRVLLLGVAAVLFGAAVVQPASLTASGFTAGILIAAVESTRLVASPHARNEVRRGTRG